MGGNKDSGTGDRPGGGGTKRGLGDDVGIGSGSEG